MHTQRNGEYSILKQNIERGNPLKIERSPYLADKVALSRSLDDLDLLICKAVQLIHETVDLVISGVDLPL